MKNIKTFENYWEKEENERQEKRKDNEELAREILAENPMSKEHDLYMFVGRDEFKEEKDGRYTKSLEIENMVKVTPEDAGVTGWGLSMRAQVQGGKVYHIWLPKEVEEMVSGKGSSSLEPWLVDLINKHKQTGGKKVDNIDQRLKDIRQRRNDAKKFNL